MHSVLIVLVIYTQCLASGLRPRYEERFEGDDGRWKLPDFTFEDDAGDPIIWEHLGMMDDSGYADDWTRKREWYVEQGITEGENLFCTDEIGGLDAAKVIQVISEIKQLVE